MAWAWSSGASSCANTRLPNSPWYSARTRSAGPSRGSARDIRGLRDRLPQWELWVREFEIMKGRASEEDTKICSLGALIPEEVKVALDDKPELQTFASRLAFVKRRLGMEKHRALAQLTHSQAPVSMDVGNLDLTATANLPSAEEDDADPSRLEAAYSLVGRDLARRA